MPSPYLASASSIWRNRVCAASSEEAPESATLRKEQEREVQRLMETLPAKYRLILVLRYWHDLSYAEIAGVMGITEAAVKSRLHRARLQMAEHLTKRPASAVTTAPRQSGVVQVL